MAIDIGRIAYEAFQKVINGSKHPAFNIPSWEYLSKIDQDAWRHAAVAVIHHMDNERNANGIY